MIYKDTWYAFIRGLKTRELCLCFGHLLLNFRLPSVQFFPYTRCPLLWGRVGRSRPESEQRSRPATVLIAIEGLNLVQRGD